VNDLYERVDKALDEIRPYIHSHAGDVNIVDVSDEGVVKLQMVGTCHGCPMSMLTLRLGIERIPPKKSRALPPLSRSGQTISISTKSGPKTQQPPERSSSPARRRDQAEDDLQSPLELARELPEEIGERVAAVRENVEASPVGRFAVGVYFWLIDHAPKSTRGKILIATAMFLIVLAPSLAMLYFSITSGQEATESWFGRLGYAGVFLANLASTATLFVPVPGLTAAAQALIASSGGALSPFWVGIFGGLGMGLGEITAYVAGMATSFIAKEEEIKPPRLLRPLIERVTRWVSWLMAHYGYPTLFTLSVIPNPLFEVAGWTAGATRYSFWGFLGAVVPGKITRGLLLAYLGDKVIFG
jgi:Fe-S cluster biogenesis protein NfuA/membrane protein DedA with SNARE-associated domain